eukprot:CAMPEP_0174925052 /NCGR_PEP_ID=MMETSP1355-20121228/7658_1 /TAXON_ID=464990 /ORGANISM="Hemiselmis tepida, Strain CCMP443" /LENGTH=566 /DNA_ID=CAMNT_0016170923 /DNA_START=24 /DNA_END=1725 /DNA_ORIENTATION=+
MMRGRGAVNTDFCLYLGVTQTGLRRLVAVLRSQSPLANVPAEDQLQVICRKQLAPLLPRRLLVRSDAASTLFSRLPWTSHASEVRDLVRSGFGYCYGDRAEDEGSDYDSRESDRWSDEGSDYSRDSKRTPQHLDDQTLECPMIDAALLFLGAKAGHLPVVEHLLLHQKDLLMTKTTSQRTVLFFAAEAGHLPVVQCLFKKGGKKLLMMKDKEGETALISAAMNGHMPVVQYLVEMGGTELLMMTDKYDGVTALLWAASRGHQEIVQCMCEKGGKKLLMMKDEHGKTALCHAIDQGHLPVVQCLVEIGSKELLVMQCGGAREVPSNALMQAADKGNLDIVKYLVEKGGKELLMATSSNERQTALLCASFAGHLPVVQYLVEEGGKKLLTMKDTEGYTALMWAVRSIRNNNEKVVEYLAEKGGVELLEMKDKHGNTAELVAKKQTSGSRAEGHFRVGCTGKSTNMKVHVYLSKMKKHLEGKSAKEDAPSQAAAKKPAVKKTVGIPVKGGRGGQPPAKRGKGGAGQGGRKEARAAEKPSSKVGEVADRKRKGRAGPGGGESQDRKKKKL